MGFGKNRDRDGKDLVGKRPRGEKTGVENIGMEKTGGEKTWRGENRWEKTGGKDLAPLNSVGILTCRPVILTSHYY